GERAGLGDQADRAGVGDVGRDDAGVRLPGRGDAGAVRADDPGLVALRHGVGPELGGVVHRNALGDHDAERDLGVDRLHHRGLGRGRRHEDHGDVRAGLRHGLLDRAEDGQALVNDASLAGVDPAHDLGPGGEHAAGVLRTLRARHALDDDLAVLSEPDSHQAPTAASSAARLAASSMVSTSSTPGSAASVRIFRPRAALLPSSRTTSGRVTASPRLSSSLNAETIPLATASQAVMPPKTLTNTDFTDGSDRMICRPLAMTSAEAPPPMSRKFAGFGWPGKDSPAYATTSSVDMTRPAPLPMMPTEPSSLT